MAHTHVRSGIHVFAYSGTVTLLAGPSTYAAPGQFWSAGRTAGIWSLVRPPLAEVRMK